MLVGYARVSTDDQSLDLQKDALNQHGCEKIYSDVISGAKWKRQGLEDAMRYMRKGDTLVVWKLDRLGRSLQNLIQIVNELNEKGIGFRSLQENMDTTTSGGKLIFHLFGALAEFERDIIRERTLAGLKAARERGRVGGRRKVMTEKRERMLETLEKDPHLSDVELAEMLGVSRSTLWRYRKAREAEEEGR